MTPGDTATLQQGPSTATDSYSLEGHFELVMLMDLYPGMTSFPEENVGVDEIIHDTLSEINEAIMKEDNLKQLSQRLGLDPNLSDADVVQEVANRLFTMFEDADRMNLRKKESYPEAEEHAEFDAGAKLDKLISEADSEIAKHRSFFEARGITPEF